MDTKLTLKLDQKVIESAKVYAKKKQTSVSAMVENYLQKVTSKSTQTTKISPLVESLSGIIDLPKNFNPKKDYGDYLNKKY